MSNFEKRAFEGVVNVETRAAKDGSTQHVLTGTAIVFGELSKPLVEFSDGTKLYERVLRSAFNDCDISDVLCNLEHEDMLGRTLSGTLRLDLTDKNLAYECDLPETTCGNNTRIMVARGDIRGSSFMWSRWDWDYEIEETDTGDIIRSITKIKKLKDVGPVADAAYEQTTVSTNKRDYMPEKADNKPAAYNRVPHLKRMLDLKSKM